MANDTITVDFTGTPVIGYVPISATFNASAVFGSAIEDTHSITSYNWCFNLSATPQVWETTTEPIITHLFYGIYKQNFNVKLSATVSPTTGYTGDNTVTKNSYVILGGVDRISYKENRDINLIRFLPGKFLETETETFTKFFQDYLNNMFDGQEGIVLSGSEVALVTTPIIPIPIGMWKGEDNLLDSSSNNLALASSSVWAHGDFAVPMVYADGQVGRCFYIPEIPPGMVGDTSVPVTVPTLQRNSLYNIDPAGSFTTEFLFKKDGTPTSYPYGHSLFSRASWGYSYVDFFRGFLLEIITATGGMVIRKGYGEDGPVLLQNYSHVFTVLTWVKIKLTYNAGRFELYADDVLQIPVGGYDDTPVEFDDYYGQEEELDTKYGNGYEAIWVYGAGIGGWFDEIKLYSTVV